LIWKTEPNEQVDEILKLKEKERHARYYRENRKEVLKRQKKRDRERDRVTPSKDYYKAHKEEKLKADKERYEQNKEERRAKARAYYWANKEKIAQRRKELRNADK